MRARWRAARDRHGRGMRGVLAPPSVPLSRSRSRQFDDRVLDAIERLEARWPEELADVEFAVEDVPPPPLRADEPNVVDADGVALSRLIPAQLGDRLGGRSDATPPRIVVYRRPIEARAVDGADLVDLVHDVLLEQVGTLLGLDPEEME